MRSLTLLFIAAFSPLSLWSQTPPAAPPQNQTKLGADFQREWESLTSDCTSFRSFISCAETLFTDHPIHIAVGSIAPQNGFGSGLAFVDHYTPNEEWRLSWDADAVGSINGSWRAGAYMKAIYIKTRDIEEERGRHPSGSSPQSPTDDNLVLNAYAQTISLNKIDYFGLGPATSESARAFYGMRETIPGINAWWPLYQRRLVEIALYGELNGRIVEIRGSPNQASPSIEQLYTEATAPGLTTQPAFFQHGEGFRFKTTPLFLKNRVRLNYLTTFQQYLAPGESQFSFRRFAVDLLHQFPIYAKTKNYSPSNNNGPDECSESLGRRACPSISRNLEGSFAARLFITESMTPSGHVVPFYFDPTLGGSDINGNPSLSSYQDFRFRAPNALLLEGRFEHSLWNLPIGFMFVADEGKVALNRGDIGFSHLAHSFSAGLTLRAGGFPQVSLLYAWGKEGQHTIANMNTSLLGGSTRPSLY